VPGPGRIAVTSPQLATADDYAKQVNILNAGVNSEWDNVTNNPDIGQGDFRVPPSGLAVNASPGSPGTSVD
jgi:hypothetical protein